MTPADLAMKAAFDEADAAYHSPSSMMSTLSPFPIGKQESLYAEPQARWQKSEDGASSMSRSHAQMPKLQDTYLLRRGTSPLSSNSSFVAVPDLQRLRRKPSFAQLSKDLFVATGPLPPSPPPTSMGESSRNALLPSLLSPLPSPTLRFASDDPGYSPSLASTSDTIDPTPTQTPLHPRHYPIDTQRIDQDSSYSKALRTKRKFIPFKPAKRLPHHISPSSGPQWQVHAAIVEVGDDIGDRIGIGRHYDDSTASTPAHSVKEISHSSDESIRPRSSSDEQPGSPGQQFRPAVQFEGLESPSSDESDRPPGVSTLTLEQARSLSSSFSLSKFAFPKPPSAWAGTFGHLTAPTPPVSPAVYHYEGASFELVNPHTSFLQQQDEAEASEELKSLLSGYLADEMDYDQQTGKAPSVHQPDRAPSEGRPNRVLFADADSARRTILRLLGDPVSTSSSEVDLRSSRPSLTPITPTPYRNPGGAVNDTISMALEPGGMNAGPEDHEVGDESISEEEAGSGFRRSMRSEPFNLRISKDEAAWRSGLSQRRHYANMDQLAADFTHEARYRAENMNSNGPGTIDPALHHSVSRMAGQLAGDYEPTGLPDSGFNNLEQETTVSNLVGHYQYTDASDEDEIRSIGTAVPAARDTNLWQHHSPASIEAPRGLEPGRVMPQGLVMSSTDQSLDVLRAGITRMGHRHGPSGHPPHQRAPKRPDSPIPLRIVPRMNNTETSEGNGVPTSERTYGTTGQLLNITPDPKRLMAPSPFAEERFAAALDDTRTSKELSSPVGWMPSRSLHVVNTSTSTTPLFTRDEDSSVLSISTGNLSSLDDDSIYDAHVEEDHGARGPFNRDFAFPHFREVPSRTYTLQHTTTGEQRNRFSDGRESDWETQHTSSHINLDNADVPSIPDPPSERFSEDSIANTSTYEGYNRLSHVSRASHPPIVRVESPDVADSPSLSCQDSIISDHSSNNDEHRVRQILIGHLGVSSLLHSRSVTDPDCETARTKNFEESKELEMIRQRNPTAHAAAVASFTRSSPFVRAMAPSPSRRHTNPSESSFSRAVGLTKIKQKILLSRNREASDAQELLVSGTPASSPYRGDLPPFRPSTTTVSTIPRNGAATEWSPLTPPRPAMLRVAKKPRSPLSTPDAATDKVMSIKRESIRPISATPARPTRSAMSGQTEMRNLHLVPTARSSFPSKRNLSLSRHYNLPSRHRSDLASIKVPANMHPNFSRQGPLAQYVSHRVWEDLERNEAQPVAPSSSPPLITGRSDAALSRWTRHGDPEQLVLGRKVFIAVCLFTPAAYLFAIGALDPFMFRLSKGRFAHFHPAHKQDALGVALFETAVALAVVMGVLLWIDR